MPAMRPARRVELLLFAAGWGANHFASLLVVYRRDLGFSPSSLGLLFGAYALGLVPGLVLAGRTSDARGRRSVVLPGSFIAIVASVVLAFGQHGFGVLLAGRLLYGLGMGSMMGPGSVWVTELSSAQAGPRRATLALSAGFGLGPLATGFLAEFAPAPMALPYVVHVVLMAACLAGVRAVPETAARALSRSTRNEATRPGRLLGRREVPVLAQLLPMAPWAFGLPAISLAILPGIMRPHVARPVLYSAFVIATTLLAGVLAQPLTTRLGRRGDLVGLGVGALGVALGGCAVAILSPALVFAVAVLTGAGYGLTMTCGLREVSTRASAEARGTAVGVYYVLTYIGFALPFVHAIAAKRVGDSRALGWTAAAVLGSLVARAAAAANDP
jgi:MFS family permease